MANNKKPLIIVGIVAFIAIIIGLAIIIFGGNKSDSSKDLSIQYIGGDKFIGESVTNEDFQVVHLPTNKLLTPEEFMVENVVLALDGTNVSILYTTPEGEMVESKIMVYPTLTITSINAKLINTNRYIGSTLVQEDFEVNAIDNKGNQYKLTNFNIEPNLIQAADTDVVISYTLGETVFTSNVHITTVDNFFVGLDVEFVGKNNYIGQHVTNEDFIVNAVYADGQKIPLTEFTIVNPLLNEEVTSVKISALNSKNEVVTKNIDVEGKNYVTAIHSILYAGDAQTVGNSVTVDDFEVYGLKYDGTKVKLKNCKLESGAKLETVSNVVTLSYYNEIGQLLTGTVVVNADDNIIFIGDCRTSRMEELMTNDWNYRYDVTHYISNKNANLEWLENVAIPSAQAIMDKNIYTKYRIVINLGLFDVDNVEAYAELYRSLASEKWKNHDIYVVSLNPVDEAQMDKSKIYSRNTINTAKIKTFNKTLADKMGVDITNLKFVNTNGSIINNGYVTTDGINYDDGTLFFYYALVKSMTY